MDYSLKVSNPNPVKKSGPISRLLLLWVIPLLWKGRKKNLKSDDLYEPRSSDRSSLLGNQLKKAWFHEQENARISSKRPSLLKALWTTFGREYMAITLLLVIGQCLMRISLPLLIREVLKSPSEEDRVYQQLVSGVIVIGTFLYILVDHPALHQTGILAMRCRVACSSLIYRKVLRLSKSSQGKTSIGQMVNLLANDVSRFDIYLLALCFALSAPIQLCVLAYFLWEELGPTCLGGILLITSMTILNGITAKLSTKYRGQTATRTDERSRAMSEIIVAIRVIKMYAWEKPFGILVEKLRKLEMEAVKKRGYLQGLSLTSTVSASKLVVFISLLPFVLSGGEITVEKVFFVVAVYNAINPGFFYSIPLAAAGVGEILASLKRLEDFLLLDEKADISERQNGREENAQDSQSPNEIPTISLNNVSVSWTDKKIELSEISMNASGDTIVCIVGAVGAGKTTLLHALLQEISISVGHSEVKGRISYASQEPWIFSGSIRQNILFGREFLAERYSEVTKACALLPDFEHLPSGDLTLVGDRGVSLSGGQKVRVSLARALYQEADIYLMDDPLSAVDVGVSRHLFDCCVKGFLKGKLRILVTHQLQYLSEVDYIFVLQEGKIIDSGTYAELVEEGNLIELLNTNQTNDAAIGERRISSPEKIVRQVETQHLATKQELPEEKMVEGSVSSDVYWKYFKSGESMPAIFMLFFTCIFAQVVATGIEYWLAIWANAEENWRTLDTEGDTYSANTMHLGVYGGLVVGLVFFNILRSIGWFKYTTLISVKLHDEMFARVVRSPASFFDENPPGRLMNRFTKDLGQVDELLPPMFFQSVIILLQTAGAFVIVATSNWMMVIPSAFILVVFWYAKEFYLATARDIRRIEGVAKSPVFTHATATFQGLTTIRSANAENILIQQFDSLQDSHSSAWYLLLVTSRFFSMWTELMSLFLLAFVLLSYELFPSSSRASFGLALTSTMSIFGWLQFALKQSSDVSNLMTSVERIAEYVELPSEADLESEPGKKPLPEWPQNGEILFQNVSLTYGQSEVLHNLNFRVGPGEKMGIVGRTGAGKSSIAQALMRIREPSGQIFIDGVEINKIGLHDLRKNISIIPQDPTLFCGTMRHNLDPFDQYQDFELWAVLQEVNLKDIVPDLAMKVEDGGNNFSVGQKQLLCLARAMLKKNKIIIMDEATANVDLVTDQFIRDTIQRKFTNCTIITIAHRLASIMGCDQVLVLDGGEIVEYGNPQTLLQNGRTFSAMVEDTESAK